MSAAFYLKCGGKSDLCGADCDQCSRFMDDCDGDGIWYQTENEVEASKRASDVYWGIVNDNSNAKEVLTFSAPPATIGETIEKESEARDE